MFLVKTEIRDSAIEGKGLFVLQHVPKGILIAIFTSSGAVVENLPAQALRYGVMSEQEYLHRMHDDEIVRYSGARYVGNWFVYKNQVHQEDFTNHSNDPNVLYHCGLGFARKDLNLGDELTCDYRFFFSSDDFSELDGVQVWGYPAQVALKKSTEELLKLLHEVEA